MLSTLRDGLAGATPLALRGILNATVNFILSRMHEGKPYEDALAEAQELVSPSATRRRMSRATTRWRS